MVRSLCVSALLLFSAVVHGSKYGSARNVVDLVERSTIVTRCASGDSCSRLGDDSSYSKETVLGSYNDLLSHVQSCKSALEAGRLSAESALEHVQQLGALFQTAFSQFDACGACYAGNSISTFGNVFSRLFSSFDLLLSSWQKSFPNDWTSILSGPFSRFDDSLASFLARCQSNGLAVNNFIPQSLGSFLNPLGLHSASTTLRKFGYSF